MSKKKFYPKTHWRMVNCEQYFSKAVFKTRTKTENINWDSVPEKSKNIIIIISHNTCKHIQYRYKLM